MTTEKNPYVGPSPFEEKDQTFFYGRDGEANELFSLICAHSVVLFYSQSGAGKTSLLNAGVIPRLKEKQAEVFGVARVGIRLPKDAPTKKIANVFVFNTLLSLQGEKKQPLETLARMSLGEYLRSQQRETPDKYFYPLHVLIFDQFEELFTSFQEQWDKRESFFQSVNEALEKDPFLRVLFAMREEHVTKLDPFAPMLPQRLQNRFRMERLRKKAALKAVEGPLEKTHRSYKPGVAERLVDNLLQEQIKRGSGSVPTPGEYVEPVQLQIICHGLWERLPREVKEIDRRAVAEFGDVDTALAKYYDDSLKKVVQGDPNVDEGKLRIWFGTSLITQIGTRGIVFMDEDKRKTEDDLSEKVVKLLEDRRLIRPEWRGGARWYELTHDRFIGPIRQSNDKWLGLEPADKTFFEELERKASVWVENGRLSRDLLSNEELRETRKIQERRAKLGKLVESGALKEYISASEAAFERKEIRRKITSWVILPIAAIVLISISILSSLKAGFVSRERTTKQIQRGEQAREFADVKGKEYNALAFGIEAVGLSDPDDAPPQAVEGLRFALATIDNKVWLREGVTASSPSRLEISTNGTLVLSVDDSELCVSNVLTGQKQFPCKRRPEKGDWSQVDFSPDGELIFVVMGALEIKREAGQSKLIQGGSNSAGEGADESNLLNFEGERGVFILNAWTGEQLTELQTKLKGAWGLQISDDGKHILADFSDSTRVVDVDSTTVSSPAPASQPLWRQIAISSDGSRLVAVYDGARVELLASTSGQVIGTLSVGMVKTEDMWDSIAFSRDGQRGVLVRSSPNEETIGLVWNNATGQPLASLKSKVGKIDDALFSPDDKSIVLFGKTRTETFDALTGNLIGSFSFPVRPGGFMQHSGTNVLKIEDADGKSTVSVWNAITGNPISQTEMTKYKISKAAMTPDGRQVASMSEGILMVWTVGPPLNVENLSAQELFATGCAKLQHQKEYIQVSAICKNLLRQ